MAKPTIDDIEPLLRKVEHRAALLCHFADASAVVGDHMEPPDADTLSGLADACRSIAEDVRRIRRTLDALGRLT